MNDNEQQPVTTHPGYVAHQLAQALVTAQTHEDDDTRRRAEARVRRWSGVLSGLADGTLTAGSRTPVAGLPAWVTPEVVRGGFATGEASAGAPLLECEREAARRAGVPAQRSALFAHALTDAGLAELHALLDSGAYEVSLPEEAALLTVAWLVRSGDRLGALTLLETLEPFADQLRFTPRPRPGRDTAVAEGPVVHRTSVGEASEAIAKRCPNPSVEAMREAFTVWNPYADDLLTHWLETVKLGRVLARTPDDTWNARGAELLERYEHLAAAHTRCGKHRRPKSNQAVMRTALAQTLADQPLTPACGGCSSSLSTPWCADADCPAPNGTPGSASGKQPTGPSPRNTTWPSSWCADWRTCRSTRARPRSNRSSGRSARRKPMRPGCP
ncbi:hypothetical protein [Streptomyces syringium]|uniref:hypothetical protein n=1 Tax=Streptomyces syringium TaxID=76729 RepID=UPI003455E929